MLKTWESRTVLFLAVAAGVVVVTNMVLFNQNRQAQAEVTQRAQYIQQTAQLEPLYREIVKALADLSVRNNDGQIRQMLTQQGITVSSTPTASPAPAPAPAAKSGSK